MRGLLVFLLVTLVDVNAAFAADVVDQARALYSQGRCKDTLRLLASAERDPALHDDVRAEVYLLQAVCSGATGKDTARDAALDQLVRLRPLFEPDPGVVSPPIRRALEERRAAWQAREGVTIRNVRLAPPNVVVTLGGTLTRAQRVELFVRPSGAGALVPHGADVTAGSATVPLADRALWEGAALAGGLEVVVEVRDATRVPVARLGDAVKPQVLAVSREMLPEVPAPAPAPAASPAAPPPTATAQPVDLPVEPQRHTSLLRVTLAGLLLAGAPFGVSATSCVAGCASSILGSLLLLDPMGLGERASAPMEISWAMVPLFCCVSGVSLVAGLGGVVTLAVMGLLGLFTVRETPPPA